MEKDLISKKVSRFKWCDRRFFPYVEDVLTRLPSETCLSLLDDLTFDVVSFGEADGRYYPLSSEIKELIVLNENILSHPKVAIIHTVAHELAHKVIRKGETGLYEKEAEELLSRWGFQEEVENVNYAKPWMEGEGFDAGYKWAAKQSDLSNFEKFYNEWDKGKLDDDEDRRQELLDMVDPTSILDEMGMPGKEPVPKGANVVLDEGSVDKGVVHGVMTYLKKKKQDALKRLSGPELSEGEKDELFWMILKEAIVACERIFDSRIQSLTRDYAEKYPEINAFQNTWIEVGTLLDELGKG